MKHYIVLYFTIICFLNLKGQKSDIANQSLEFQSVFSKARVPAEWERADLLVLVWHNYFDAISEIAHYAQDEGNVLIICKDSLEVIKYFKRNALNTARLQFLQSDFNSVWIRDYGPINLYMNGTDELTVVDFLYKRKRKEDDLIPLQLAHLQNIKIMQIASETMGLVQVGGNFMCNGLGTAFSSRLVLKENADLEEAELKQIFCNNLGIKEYIFFDTLPYDFIHHIDMHMKFIDEETLLVGKFPSGVADEPIIKKNVDYLLQNYKTSFGNNYKIVEIPMPDDLGRYADSTGWADYLTYTNSLIFNSTIFVPIYEIPSDKMALEIYQKHFPAYRIIGINVEEAIADGGAVHCFTYSLSALSSDYIWFSKPCDIASEDSVLNFTAYVSSSNEIKDLNLYFRYSGQKRFQRQSFTRDINVDNWFELKLPIKKREKIEYYLIAKDVQKNLIKRPITAPMGYYTVEHESLQFTDIVFNDDTLIWKGGLLSLDYFVPSANSDYLFYWRSEDDFNVRNSNLLDASVRIKPEDRDFVYKFSLIISDGTNLMYKYFYVKRLVNVNELWFKR